MTTMPPGFRPEITVFGERLKAVEVRDDIADGDEVVVVYLNLDAGNAEAKKSCRVATLEHWIEWDRNAREAKRRKP